MKIKFLFCLSFLFVLSNFYSQVTDAKKEAVRKQVKKTFLRPPSYDSTKTLEEQFKFENRYQFIGLQLFLPPVVNPETGPVVFSENNSNIKKESYFTITDVLGPEFIEQLKQKKAVNLCGYKFKDLNSSSWKEIIIHAIFVLREDNKSDSLYWIVCESKQSPYSCSNFNSFIPLPYFEKQKQVYQKQSVINLTDKSKWFCKEVTLLKDKDRGCQDSTYQVFCLLTNEKSEQINRSISDRSSNDLITEKEYIWLDHANKNQKNKLLKERNEVREKRKAECISKFGQHYGTLIAQGKIEAGMTTDMCKEAWGAPWNISETGTKEIWFYNWKYNLLFENKILVKIKQ
jgi:hypothetical protein